MKLKDEQIEEKIKIFQNLKQDRKQQIYLQSKKELEMQKELQMEKELQKELQEQ